MIKVIDGEGGTFALKNNLFLDHVLTGLQTLCFWTEKQSIAPNENNNNNNNNNKTIFNNFNSLHIERGF